MSTGDAVPGLPSPRSMLLVGGCAVGLACGFAGLYFSTLSVFLKPIALSLGWSRADVSAATLISMLALALGAPLQGLLIDRWGDARVIGLSVLLFAAALLAFSVVPGERVLMGVCSFMMGICTVATGPNGYLSVLPHWFDRRLGLALSCAMVGVGVGAVAWPKVAQILIQAQGWRGAYGSLSMCALAGGGAAYGLLKAGQIGQRSRSWKAPLNESGIDSNGESIAGLSLQTASRGHQFWILAWIMAVGGSAGLGMTVHLVAMLDDRGVDPARAASAAALSGAGVLAGRLAAGTLLDWFHATKIGGAIYALAALGTVLFLTHALEGFGKIAIGAMLLGLALGAEGDLLAFVVRRYFGLQSFAAIYGSLFSAYALGGVAGPVLFGLSFDRLGSYKLVMILSVIGLLANVVLIATLGKYRFEATAAPIKQQ